MRTYVCETVTVPGMERINSLAMSPCGYLCIGGTGQVPFAVYDTRGNRFVSSVAGALPVDGEYLYRVLTVSRKDGKIYGALAANNDKVQFHHLEYPGGHIFCYDVNEERLLDLGIPIPNEGIRGLVASWDGRYLLGISHPSNRLFVYEPGTGKIRDIGPISCKFRQGYSFIVSPTGYVYGYGAGDGAYGKFFKYHPDNDHYEVLAQPDGLRLPDGDGCSYFSSLDAVASGSSGDIFCSTYPWGDLLAFYPETEEFKYIARPAVTGDINIKSTPSLHRSEQTGHEGRLSCLAVDDQGTVFGAAGYGDITLFSYNDKDGKFVKYGMEFKSGNAPNHVHALALDDEGAVYLGGDSKGMLCIGKFKDGVGRIFSTGTAERYTFETRSINVGTICSICELMLASDGMVYMGGTCKAGRGGLLACYNPATDQVTDLHLERYFPFEEKIHRALVEGPDGIIYGGTGMNKDLAGSGFEYPGGHLFSYDPKTQNVEDLGIPVKGDLIFSINIDHAGENIYGGTYPSHSFFRYNIKTRRLENKGFICSYWAYSYKYVIDKENCVYGTGDEGYFFKYNPREDSFRYTKAKLPDNCFSLDCVVSHPQFGMYCSSHGDDGCDYVFRLDAEREKLEYIGKPTRGRTPALGFDSEGRLYMAAGSSRDWLFRYDPESKITENLGPIEFAAGNEKAHAYRIHNIVIDSRNMVYLGETDYYRPDNKYLYIGYPSNIKTR